MHQLHEMPPVLGASLHSRAADVDVGRSWPVQPSAPDGLSAQALAWDVVYICALSKSDLQRRHVCPTNRCCIQVVVRRGTAMPWWGYPAARGVGGGGGGGGGQHR